MEDNLSKFVPSANSLRLPDERLGRINGIRVYNI